MTVQSNFSAIRGVPFGQIILAPENVRKTNSETGIEELAELIYAEGVLQNLAGYELTPARGKRITQCAAVAGGRRWRALGLLVKQGRIDRSYIVPMLITSKERAVAISIAENSAREALHPADEFEAFRALVDAGQSIEDVAAHFGVNPLIVQRRLKLANVAPEFIQLYREKKLTLEHLMALAVTDDHEKQRQAWKGAPAHGRTAYALREALTETEISSRDPLARFVTVKAYEKAGGQCRRDLFSEEDNVFLQDVDLLKRLAQQKLEKQAEQLKGEGLAWVDVSPRVVDYSDRAGYGRVGTSLREPTNKEKDKLEALDQELAQISSAVDESSEDDEAFAKLDERREEIEEAQDKLREALTVPDPEQQAKAGALVCIDHNGKLRVETGLLKSEDAKLFAAKAKADSRAAAEPGARTHSAALLLRLTAHRTQALRAVFAQNPEVALAAVVHRFVINTFWDFRSASDSALRIDTREVALQGFAKDLEHTQAYAWLDAQEKHLRSMLPEDPQALFQWILEQSYVEKLALLAFCAARCLDAVQNHERESEADALARALRMDLRQWWTPSAAGYFACIPRTATLQAVTEGASAEISATMEKLKKQPLAQEAEKALAGTGWVPAFVRNAWVPPAL